MTTDPELENTPEEPSEETTRRSFLKQGAKGALLLPYVVPAIETILLSPAPADADDDDGSSNSGGSGGSPSVIGNEVPPPPGDDDDDDGSSKSDSNDDDGREYGEPKDRSSDDNKNK